MIIKHKNYNNSISRCLDSETYLVDKNLRLCCINTKHYQQELQLIQHHASLTQNSYALKVALNIKAGDEINGGRHNTDNLVKTRVSNKKVFLICQSCFWCASYISSNNDDLSYYTPTNCPECIKGNIESIPIAQNEGYTFDYSGTRGVTLQFLRWHDQSNWKQID